MMMSNLSDELLNNAPTAEDMNNNDANPVTVVAVATDKSGRQESTRKWGTFPTLEVAECAMRLADDTQQLDVQVKATLDQYEMYALAEYHSRALAIQEWREEHNLPYGGSYRRRRLDDLANLCGERFVGEILGKARQELKRTMPMLLESATLTSTY